MSERKIRIKLDCLSVQLFGGVVILQQRIRILGDLVRAQIKHVCVGVLRRFASGPRFFIFAQRCQKGFGNFSG